MPYEKKVDFLERIEGMAKEKEAEDEDDSVSVAIRDRLVVDVLEFGGPERIGYELAYFLVSMSRVVLEITRELSLKQKTKEEVEIDDLFDELDGKKPGVKSSRKYDDYDYYDDDFSGTLPMEEELFADDEYDDYDLEYNYGDDDELIENATGAIEPQRLTDTLANHKPIDPDAPVRPKRPRTRSEGVNQKFHVENDDDLKMDFIDLDD